MRISIGILSLSLALLVGCGGSATGSLKGSSATSNANAASPSTPSSGSPQSNPNQNVISQIQAQASWDGCTATRNGGECAAGMGVAAFSYTEHQSQPSLTGDSTVFWIGGSQPYSNALWWDTLNGDTQSTHFTYDLQFYVDNPEAAQALEFDVNQALGGNRYVWGTECNYRQTGKWDIWNDAAHQWEPTGVACPVVSANQWHHLTWQLERVDTKVHYISVTLDGKTSTVDQYRDFQSGFDGQGVSVAFQMDGDFQQTPYKVWLDQVTLTSWQ